MAFSINYCDFFFQRYNEYISAQQVTASLNDMEHHSTAKRLFIVSILSSVCFFLKSIELDLPSSGSFEAHESGDYLAVPASGDDDLGQYLTINNFELMAPQFAGSFTKDYTTPEGRMQAYFANLLTNEAANSHGSCGYVAFIQYLSYFDTFHNDHLIPYPYEVFSNTSYSTWAGAMTVSPGVINQSYPLPSDPEYIFENNVWVENINGYKSMDFYNFVQANKNTDFQMKLMDIVNTHRNNPPAPLYYTCGVGMWNYHLILDELYGTGTYTYQYFTKESFNASAVSDSSCVSGMFNGVASLLNAGKPAILHIARLHQGSYADYHAVVAYRLDSQGIHCNFGWSSLPSSTDTVLDLDPNSSDPYYITEYGYISDFSSSNESHAGNYVIGGLKYCGCGIRAVHSFTISQFNNSFHRKQCGCGYQCNEPHFIFEGQPYNGICAGCGASSRFLVTAPLPYED